MKRTMGETAMKPFVLAASARWLGALMISCAIVANSLSSAMAEDVPSKPDLPAKPRPGSAASRPAPSKAAPSPEEAVIKKLEFKQANMLDVVRALADMSGLNIVATEDAAKKNVTVFLQDVTVKDALDTITKNSGLWYRQDKTSKAYRIMTTDEYQRDMVVYREDTTRIFNLLHPNPTEVATTIRDIYGQRVIFPQLCDAGSIRKLGGNNTNAGGTVGNVRATTRNTASGYQNNAQQNMNARNMVPGGVQTDRQINEKLTSDQLQQIEEVVVSANGNTIASEQLSKISGREPPIYLSVNCEHNLIIARSSDADSIRDIESLIKQMDRPTPQVLLEMRVMEMEMTDSFRQLFQLSGQSGDGKHSFSLGFPSETGSSLAYTYMNNLITARMEMLQKNNQAQVLSSPVLLASNNRQSEVFVGTEQLMVTDWVPGQYFPATANSPAYVIPPAARTENTDIGPKLTIVPKINADKTVTLQINQEVSSIKSNAATVPVAVYNSNGTSVIVDKMVDGKNVARVNGIVTAKDGLTVAIAGLISGKTSHSISKVPLLSEIPVLGELFKRKEEINSKTEMILLITPRIISNPAESEDVSRSVVDPISEQAW